MSDFERYGLFTSFRFEVDPQDLAAMRRVVDELRSIEAAVNQTQKAIDKNGIAQGFRQFGRQANHAVGGAAQQFDQLRRQNSQARSQVQGITAEFRALRAEARNIDFGDLTDVAQFRQASREIDRYTQQLRALEQQVDRSSPQGRTLAADLQRQQTIARGRVGMAEQQRAAAIAQQRQGVATGVAATGAAVMLPIVGVGRQAIQITSDFNDQMQAVRAVSEMTADQMQRVRDTAKRLGATTRFSASEAASGFVLLAQAGYAVEDQLQAIEGTLNLAAAGNLELSRATEITISTLGQFQMGAERATHVANVLAKAAAMGQIDVSDIGMSLKYAGVAAKRANLSLEQSASMLALLSEGGLKGEMAGTALGQMLDGLVAPSSSGAAALRQLRVETTDLTGKLLPYEKILGQTIEALSGVADESERAALQNKIFGTVGGRAAGILMPRFNKIATTTAEIIATADQGIGAASEQARTMESDIGGSFRSLRSAMEGVFIEIGEVLAPIVKTAADAISSVLVAFISLPKPIKTVVVLAGLATAAIASLAVVGGTAAIAFYGFKGALAEARIGMIALQASSIPLTGFFGRVMAAFSGGGIVAGFQALGAAVAGLGTTAATAVSALAAFFTGPIGLGIAAFTAILAIVQFLIPQINVLGKVLSTIAAPIGFVFGVVKGIAQGIWEALSPIREELAPLGNALNPIGAAIQYIGGAIQEAAKTFQRFAEVGASVGRVIGSVIGSLVVGPIVALIRGIKFVSTIFTGAVDTIRGAWQGFIDWFMSMPLVQFAVTMGQGLIAALNHNPTVVIPQAWERAISVIRSLLQGLRSFGAIVGSALSQLLNPGKLFGSLVTGLIEKVRQLINNLKQSGIGNLFGGAINGLDKFLQKLQIMADQPTMMAIAPVVDNGAVQNRQTVEQPVSAAVNFVTDGIDRIKTPLLDNKIVQTVQQVYQEAKVRSAPFTPVPHATPSPIVNPKLPDAQQLNQPTINAVAPSVQAAVEIVQQGFDSIFSAWQDRWAALQRSGNTDVASLFRPGLLELRQSLTALGQNLKKFLGETIGAIAALDFSRAKTAALDFGGSLLGVLQQASGAIGSLTLSAITFGVFSLASLGPMVLVLGGIALGAAAIATNFLGVRTILGGIIKVVLGIGDAASSVVIGLIRVIRGIIKILQGIPAAIDGDFQQILNGWRIVMLGIQDGAVGLVRGIGTIFEGGVQGIRGLFEGLGQIIRFDVFGGITAAVQSFVQQATAMIEKFVDRTTALLQKPVQVARGLVNTLNRGKQKAADTAANPVEAAQQSSVGRADGTVSNTVMDAAVQYRSTREPQKFDARLASAPDLPAMPQVKAKPGQDWTGVADDLDKVESQMMKLQEQSRASFQSVTAGVSSVGVALNNFAPTAAAPLFVILDLIDAFQGIRNIIPAVKAAVIGNAATVAAANATTTASNTTTAVSYEAVRFAALRTTAAQWTAIAASKSVALWSGIVASTNFLMAGGFGAIAVAATAAWSAILAPIMPIVLAIGAVIAGLFVIKHAFDQNFGGIRDTIEQIISEARGAIGGIVEAFGNLVRVADEAGKPIRELMMGLGSGILAGVFQAVLVPLRITIWLVSSAFKLIAGIIRLIAVALTPVIKVLAIPFKIIEAIIQGIARFINGIKDAIKSIGQSIWRALPSPIKWLIETLQKGINFIFSSSPEPQKPQRFSTGGLVTGSSGGDVIPALLSNREFVMNRQATAQNMGLLEALNAGVPVQQILSSLVPMLPLGQYGQLEGIGLSAQSIALPVPVLPPQIGAIDNLTQPISIQVTIQNITIQGADASTAQATATRIQDEILDAMEDPRFQVRVREALRNLTERMR